MTTLGRAGAAVSWNEPGRLASCHVVVCAEVERPGVRVLRGPGRCPPVPRAGRGHLGGRSAAESFGPRSRLRPSPPSSTLGELRRLGDGQRVVAPGKASVLRGLHQAEPVQPPDERVGGLPRRREHLVLARACVFGRQPPPAWRDGEGRRRRRARVAQDLARRAVGPHDQAASIRRARKPMRSARTVGRARGNAVPDETDLSRVEGAQGRRLSRRCQSADASRQPTDTKSRQFGDARCRLDDSSGNAGRVIDAVAPAEPLRRVVRSRHRRAGTE